MVISTREDVVRLSGSLEKNEWTRVKVVDHLLLQQHPKGVVVDCAELDAISDSGAAMFLEAVSELAATGTPIILASVPLNVQGSLESLPGGERLAHVAASVETARAAYGVIATSPGDRR